MNPQDLKQAIAACDLCNQVPLISGVHGIGKSDTIKQYAKENNMHCEILILSLMDTGDLLGIPRSVEVGGVYSTVWSAPAWFNRIVDAAWPIEMNFEDLEFKDLEFKEFVQSELSRS